VENIAVINGSIILRIDAFTGPVIFIPAKRVNIARIVENNTIPRMDSHPVLPKLKCNVPFDIPQIKKDKAADNVTKALVMIEGIC
jgi:hypothetical protein